MISSFLFSLLSLKSSIIRRFCSLLKYIPQSRLPLLFLIIIIALDKPSLADNLESPTNQPKSNVSRNEEPFYFPGFTLHHFSSIYPERLSLLEVYQKELNSQPKELNLSPTEILNSSGGAKPWWKRDFHSSVGLAMATGSAVTFLQLWSIKNLPTLVWTSWIWTLLGGSGLYLFYAELTDQIPSKETQSSNSNFSFSYTPYVINTQKQSDLTGNPTYTMGWGYGQLFQYFSPSWWYLKLEIQATPLADNGWVNLSNEFLKVEPVGIHFSLPILSEIYGGYSTFLSAILVQDYTSMMEEWAKGVVLMNGHGFEAGITLTIPIWKITDLILSGDGAYYPWLYYPEISGKKAPFLAVVNYNDLRGADYYYWYRYRIQIRNPIVELIPSRRWRKAFDILIGGEMQTLKAGGKGSGVNNRGISITFTFTGG